MVDSWEEHLRQHERLTVTDLDVERRAKAPQRGDGPAAVRHLLSAPAAARARHRITDGSRSAHDQDRSAHE